MVKFSIKKRSARGDWQFLDVNEFAGKTLGEVFLSLEGQEAVAEFDIDGARCFFCGTEHWLAQMKKRGAAVLFSVAHARLQDTRPDLLQEVVPLADHIADIFGGQVKSVQVTNG